MVSSKKCSICKEEKELSFFNRSKKTKDKYNYYCRECSKLMGRIHYKKNKDKYILKALKWSKENKSKKIISQRKCAIKYYYKNKNEIRIKKNNYRNSNKEKESERGKKYNRENKEKRKLKGKEYVDCISDSYAVHKIIRGSILKTEDIPDEMIKAYRYNLKLKRAIRGRL